jgi:hypothetical protein
MRGPTWRAGSIIPLSSRILLSFAQRADTVSLQLDRRRVAIVCERLLGHPLDMELQDALRPTPWHGDDAPPSPVKAGEKAAGAIQADYEV